MLQFKLAEGASADAAQWGDLGYATAYERSFEQFAALQQDGTIAADVRFQMQYPTHWRRWRGRLWRRTWWRSRRPTSEHCSPIWTVR